MKLQPIAGVTAKGTTFLNRRAFLNSSTLGFAACAVSSLLPSHLIADDFSVENEFETQFQKLLQIPVENRNFISSVSDFLDLAEKRYAAFLDWYGNKVKITTKERDNRKKELTILEAIGKKTIDSYRGYDILNGKDVDSDFLNHYADIVKYEGSPQAILNAFGAMRTLIFKSDEEGFYLAEDHTDAFLKILENAIEAMNKLPATNYELQATLFEVLVDTRYVSDPKWQGYIQEKFVDYLTNHYLGSPKNQNDSEGVLSFVNSVTQRQFDVQEPKIAFPRVFLYHILNKNPKYFESGVKAWIKDAKTKLKTNSSLEELFDMLHDGVKILTFFNADTLSRVKDNSYFGNVFYRHFAPELKIPTSVTQNWAEENIAKPLDEVFLLCTQDARFLTMTTEEKKVSSTGNIERFIEDSKWNSMNQYVSNLSYCRDDEFCTQVAAHAKSRLSDKDSFIREKAYETFGIAASAISDKDPLQEHFLFLKQALIEAKTCQDVRGIAYACARGLEGSPQGMSLNDFTGWLNRIFTRENKFTDLIEDRLTPAQKMIVDMLQIASGNSTCAMKLMPDRRFPGPTFRRTYKLPDGTLKTIEVTPRINYDDDKEIRKTAKLVKEEAFYSDENKQDGIALHQLFHNAFIFLAYVAGQLETEHKMDDAFRFKGQIIDYLERSILFNLVEYDGFGYSTNWGEKIGAMFELYESLHINGEDSNKYIDFKDKAFSGMFFEKNDESKKFFGERIPLFKMINDGIEEYAVGEAAIKTGNDIRGLFIHSGEYKDKVARTKTTQTYQDLIKESRRSVEILKAKIALGALNTARNRGMQPVRVLLYKMGNNTHFDNLMLADPVGYTKSIYRVDITKQAV